MCLMWLMHVGCLQEFADARHTQTRGSTPQMSFIQPGVSSMQYLSFLASRFLRRCRFTYWWLLDQCASVWLVDKSASVTPAAFSSETWWFACTRRYHLLRCRIRQPSVQIYQQLATLVWWSCHSMFRRPPLLTSSLGRCCPCKTICKPAQRLCR